MILPHSASIFTHTADNSGTQIDGWNNATQTAVRCQLTPESSAAAFERFGVEIDQPFLLITLSTYESLLVPGNRVVVGSTEYRVKTPGKTFSSIGAADHSSCLIAKVT